MKKVILFCVLIYGLTLYSQAGTYNRGHGNTDNTIIKWTLKLNTNGTFLYHFLRDLSAVSKANKEENFYGKGTWIFNGKIISFKSGKEDFDETYTVNLNNSKARYITKSPRDTSGRIVKTALRFYESETSYIIGLALFKQ